MRDHRLAAIRGGKGDRLDAPVGMRILRRFDHRLDRRPIVAEEAAIGVEHRVGGWRLSCVVAIGARDDTAQLLR